MQTFEPAMIQPIWFLKPLKPVVTMKLVAMTSQEFLLLARDLYKYARIRTGNDSACLVLEASETGSNDLARIPIAGTGLI